jgi:hypothetical protein
VPATLSLTLGAPGTFGAFTPGVAKDYPAWTAATVTSTAGDAALAVSEPGHLTNGTFALPQPLAAREQELQLEAVEERDQRAREHRRVVLRRDRAALLVGAEALGDPGPRAVVGDARKASRKRSLDDAVLTLQDWIP